MGAKIRKLTTWVWNVKERIILIIMIIILCQRVYDVMNPETEDAAARIPPMPFSTSDNVPIPRNPPLPPPDLAPQNWILLESRPNTLFVKPRSGPNVNDNQEDVTDLVLHRIRNSGRVPRVQISTGQGRPRWYEEGAKFESYEIVFIDPENQTCQVYSEEASKPITLTLK